MSASLNESDFRGQSYNKLIVVGKTSQKSSNGTYNWKFKCDCGSIVITRMDKVKSGHTKSCGCYKSGVLSKVATTHGCSQKEKLYRIWEGMKARCYNKNKDHYEDYGGRGIKVYKTWIDSYPTFKDYVSTLPNFPALHLTKSTERAILSIDRIDNNGDYKPGNIKWSTQSEQLNNRRKVQNNKRRTKQMAAGKDWGDVDATGGFEDKKRVSDLLPIIDKNDFKKKYKLYRFVDGVQPYQEIWLPIFNKGKPVISKTGKPVRVPFYVTNYNLETHKIDDSLPACPFVETAEKMNKHLADDDQLRVKQGYLANAIDREAQENPPKKVVPPTKAELKAKFYDIESPSTKMTAVFDMTPSLFRKIKGLRGLNKAKNKKTGETTEYNVTDPKYGCDVNIKFDPSEKGGAMYDAQKGERTPLTEEEQEYLLWDISSVIEPMDFKEAKKEAERLWKEFSKSIKGGKSLDDDDDDLPDDLEDEDEKPAKKGKKKSKVDDDDDDDEPVVKNKGKKKSKVEDDDDEDEDDEPVKKKSAKKKKVADDDDDSDDDPDVDLDDDDDDEPVSKKKSAKKKKPADDDDDEDEDDEPVVKKGSKSKGKKKPADDDDDDDEIEGLDDDDDSDDDDDDDEPVSKKNSKKKPVDDEDDEDDDEPVSKKKSAKNKKVVDDDDDDDDDDD